MLVDGLRFGRNRMKKIIAVALCLVSAMAHAQVTIKTDNRVEILAVNQAINQVPHKGKGDLKIANGVNQLLVRVTALVDSNGGKKKFNSLPMVVLFEANDQVLELQTPFAMRDERAIEKFQQQPSVSITSNGQAVPYTMGVIHDQTFALIKDYDEMLAGYNQSGEAAAIQAKPKAEPLVLPVVKQQETKAGTASVEASIEQQYLALTPEQRQAFISWAVKHINQ